MGILSREGNGEEMKTKRYDAKQAALLLCLAPLGALVWLLNKCANGCKRGYKKFHAMATDISRYIATVMEKNNLNI
jgi:hypothetical protein